MKPSVKFKISEIWDEIKHDDIQLIEKICEALEDKLPIKYDDDKIEFEVIIRNMSVKR